MQVQGWTKITFPGCVNMRWNSCVFLPATGAENAIVSPHIHRTWEPYFCRSLYVEGREIPKLNSWQKSKFNPFEKKKERAFQNKIGLIIRLDLGPEGRFLIVSYLSDWLTRAKELIRWLNTWLADGPFIKAVYGQDRPLLNCRVEVNPMINQRRIHLIPWIETTTD